MAIVNICIGGIVTCAGVNMATFTPAVKHSNAFNALGVVL